MSGWITSILWTPHSPLSTPHFSLFIFHFSLAHWPIGLAHSHQIMSPSLIDCNGKPCDFMRFTRNLSLALSDSAAEGATAGLAHKPGGASLGPILSI